MHPGNKKHDTYKRHVARALPAPQPSHQVSGKRYMWSAAHYFGLPCRPPFSLPGLYNPVLACLVHLFSPHTAPLLHTSLMPTFPPHLRVTRGEICTHLRNPGQPQAPVRPAPLPLLATREGQDDIQILRRRSPQVRCSMGQVMSLFVLFFLYLPILSFMYCLFREAWLGIIYFSYVYIF